MKHHILVKFFAVFLCTCTLLCCVLSGVGIALTASLGLYGTDVEGLYRQRLENDLLHLSEVIATRYAAAALSNCPDGHSAAAGTGHGPALPQAQRAW